ncbi:MAG: hypothetical protein IPM79_11660 [Polyangiaceae bacterium]|nr:hypothetical protein [Polyangiaceae bacterium]
MTPESVRAAARAGQPEAVELAAQLVAEQPNDATSWSAAAYVRARLGDLAGAIDHASRAIEIAPTEPAYFFKRGRYRLRTGETRLAEQDFSSGLRLCDLHGNDYYRCSLQMFRAHARIEMGLHAEAEADLRGVPPSTRIWVSGEKTVKALLELCRRQSH